MTEQLSLTTWVKNTMRPRRRRPRTRILLVDDFKPFCAYISKLLGGKPDYQVVGAAFDGLQAIEGAEKLRPDIVLIDIGLPELNGLEAARRIRERVPSSKIVFLTQETAPEIVEEGLRLGASGYVVKQHAGKDLLPGLEAVLRGQPFVSGRLELAGLALRP
jgi:DNA-binding NarL/FixJ family response regulator